MAEQRKALVRLDHIYKTFNPGSVSQMGVFQDFSFEIMEGEFISVVGLQRLGQDHHAQSHLRLHPRG